MAETLEKNESLKEKIKSKFSFLKNKDSFFYYVCLLVLTSLLFFGLALITQRFTTPYGGDFSQQTYQFYFNIYDDWWTFFKTGQFPAYDANTFLGADNIMSNSYYGLFSPFTFIILFFPRNFIPQVMSLVSICRLVVGALFFRLYLKYLGTSENTARTFSFAYAFIGWMAYNLWFNSFYEVLTFFPLILYGIEKVIKERKIWALSLGYFLLGICNYFFLLSLGIYGVIYAGFRYFQTLKTRNLKDNLLVILYGFLGFLFGMGLGMFSVLPSLFAGFSINRATQSTYFSALKDAFASKDKDTIIYLIFRCWSSSAIEKPDPIDTYYVSFYFPLVSYFYPPVSDRYVNLLHYSYFENTGCSMFIYTPCMILMGGAIYRSIINKKFSHLIAFVCLFCALFIPFFYFLCGAFVTPYGRWEIVVAVSAVTYVAINFDHRKEMPWFVILSSGLITLGIMIWTYFISLKVTTKYENIVETPEILWVVIYEIALCAILTGLLTGFWKKKYLPLFIKGSLITEIAVVGTLITSYHSLQNIRNSAAGGFDYFYNEQKVIDEINENDDSYFRIQFTRQQDLNTNIGMLENFNGTGTFHSFYNNNVDDFLRMSQVMLSDTNWKGNACWKRTNLDEFLGVKYYVTADSETTWNYYIGSGELTRKVVYEPNVPLGYERIDDSNIDDGYRVYKNKYQIDLGTSYSNIFFKNECDDGIHNGFYPITSSTNYVLRNEEAYFKGAILDNDDVYEIKSLYGDAFNYFQNPPVQEALSFGISNTGIYRNKDNKYFDPENTTRDINEESLVTYEEAKENPKNIQLVFEPRMGKFPTSEEGTYFAFNYPVRTNYSNYRASIYLIGEDDKVITFDWFHHNSRNSSRTLRGFYVKEQLKRIIVCVDGDKFSTVPTLYYEPFENCILRYQTAIKNGLKDVKYKVNKLSFKTDYENPRFVVTQLAYTGGWKVFATDESGNKAQLKVYNSMGGFVGFVAPKGNITYSMEYLTPHILPGIAITLCSLFGGVTVSVVPIIVKKYKKRED